MPSVVGEAVISVAGLGWGPEQAGVRAAVVARRLGLRARPVKLADRVMLRGGSAGSANLASMALKATTASSRQGWCIVVVGTGSTLAYRTSSKPTTRSSAGTRTPAFSRELMSRAATSSLAQSVRPVDRTRRR